MFLTNGCGYVFGIAFADDNDGMINRGFNLLLLEFGIPPIGTQLHFYQRYINRYGHQFDEDDVWGVYTGTRHMR